MAKKIKFPLEMRDGVQVRNIEELREYFDIEKALGYLLDGRLLTWLEDRYYTHESEEIRKLDVYATDIKEKLGEILGVEINVDSDFDVETIEWRRERLLKLKQYTDDEDIWNKVDYVAFNQEELSDLLDEECKEIYLCGEKFQVPYCIENMLYIGVNNPEVFINATGEIDLEEKNISFKEVCILNEDIENAEELYKEGMDHLWMRNGKEYSVEKAERLFDRAAKKGHADAIARLADIYSDDEEKYGKTKEEIKELIEESIRLGSYFGIGLKGAACCLGMIYEKDVEEGKKLILQALDKGETKYIWVLTDSIECSLQEEIEYYNKGIELNDALCAYRMGRLYRSGNEIIRQDSNEEMGYYEKSIQYEESGVPSRWGIGYYLYASNLVNGIGRTKNVNKAIDYYKKLCTEKYRDGDAAFEIGKLYFDGNEIKKDEYPACEYFKKGAEWNHKDSIFMYGRCQFEGKGTYKNIEEGFKNMLSAVKGGCSGNINDDFVHAMLTKYVGGGIIGGRIANGGFYYFSSEKRTVDYLAKNITVINFIAYNNIFDGIASRKKLAEWSDDLGMFDSACYFSYCNSSIAALIAQDHKAVVYIINEDNQSIRKQEEFSLSCSTLASTENIRLDIEAGEMSDTLIYGDENYGLKKVSISH